MKVTRAFLNYPTEMNNFFGLSNYSLAPISDIILIASRLENMFFYILVYRDGFNCNAFFETAS